MKKLFPFQLKLLDSVFIWLFLLSPFLGFGQEKHQLKGRVFTDSIVDVPINIYNKTQETGRVTQKNGKFELEVTEGDELVFSFLGYRDYHLRVGEEILERDSLLIHLKQKVNLLREVRLNTGELTGDLSKDIEQTYFYDPKKIGFPIQEREELTFTERQFLADGKQIFPSLTSVNVIALINWFSGKRKWQKRRIAVQNVSLEVEKAKNMYPLQFFTKDLQLPEEFIEGFLYYCTTLSDFKAVLHSDDRLGRIEYLKKEALIYKTRMGIGKTKRSGTESE